jgi:hypothetical protein
MEEQETQELLAQARAFNIDFDTLLYHLKARILPTLRLGKVQQPRHFDYWEKEKGGFYWYGEEQMPKPDSKSLLYVGEWCYLGNHPDVMRIERLFSKAAERLRNNPFENIHKNNPDYKSFKDSIASQKVTLHEDLEGSHDDDGLLRIASLRVLAGGIAAYLDPLYLIRPSHHYPIDLSDHSQTKLAEKAEIGRLVYPSDKTVTSAKRLIRNIKEDEGIVDPSMEVIARGEPFASEKRTVPIRALIREMTLLSRILLNTLNGKKDRFPMSAIQHALNLMDDQPSNTLISKYQALYDDSADEPMTKTIQNNKDNAYSLMLD